MFNECHISTQVSRSRRVSKKCQNVDSTNEKSEIVNHFKREGYPRQTIYDTTKPYATWRDNQRQKKTSRSASWTSAGKNKLKRLINNRKMAGQLII